MIHYLVGYFDITVLGGSGIKLIERLGVVETIIVLFETIVES
jgi:hypothetical protein